MAIRNPNLNEDVLAYDQLQTDEINRVGNEIVGKLAKVNSIRTELINDNTDPTYGGIIFGRGTTSRASAIVSVYSVDSATNPISFSGLSVLVRWDDNANRMVAYFTKNGQSLKDTRIVANVIIIDYEIFG